MPGVKGWVRGPWPAQLMHSLGFRAAGKAGCPACAVRPGIRLELLPPLLAAARRRLDHLAPYADGLCALRVVEEVPADWHKSGTESK